MERVSSLSVLRRMRESFQREQNYWLGGIRCLLTRWKSREERWIQPWPENSSRMNGRNERAAYQDFLALWKDADPDIPVLKQAKAEYEKLQ